MKNRACSVTLHSSYLWIILNASQEGSQKQCQINQIRLHGETKHRDLYSLGSDFMVTGFKVWSGRRKVT